MNFYDVLAAEKWGGGIPTTNFFDLLFAQSISGEQWQVYEGTLPATFNANGSDLRQYQVCGNTGGVGDKTLNLFDLSTCVFGKYIDSNGNEQTSYSTTSWDKINHSNYIAVVASANYCFSHKGVHAISSLRTVAISWYDSSKNFLIRNGKDLSVNTLEYYISAQAPQNAAFAIVNFVGYSSDTFEQDYFAPGTTPPASFVPFGYEVDMSVSDDTSTTTTPIYIGDDPLGKDEYVDYQAGKVYRMIDGILTPTDPPVPLPALPTCEGTTVIDYAGESVAPEKVYLEYQGGK